MQIIDPPAAGYSGEMETFDAMKTDDHTIRKVVLGIGMVVGAGAGAYNSTLECD
jgi:hypothetical protein